MGRKAIATTWDQIPDEAVRPGVRRRAFGNDGAMLVMNELKPGMTVNPHVHTDFDQLAYIVSGTALYHVDGVPHKVGPGSLILIPAGQTHHIEPTGSEPVMNLDVFGPARKDYMHLLEWMKGK
ncbi:MAG: cupin domain-containing protein [Chloroflexi bacterium]|nr:cupin domain-containing protein [Chloroflexota bacterium]